MVVVAAVAAAVAAAMIDTVSVTVIETVHCRNRIQFLHGVSSVRGQESKPG